MATYELARMSDPFYPPSTINIDDISPKDAFAAQRARHDAHEYNNRAIIEPIPPSRLMIGPIMDKRLYEGMAIDDRFHEDMFNACSGNGMNPWYKNSYEDYAMESTPLSHRTSSEGDIEATQAMDWPESAGITIATPPVKSETNDHQNAITSKKPIIHESIEVIENNVEINTNIVTELQLLRACIQATMTGDARCKALGIISSLEYKLDPDLFTPPRKVYASAALAQIDATSGRSIV